MPEYPEKIVLGEGWPCLVKKGRAAGLVNTKGSALKRLEDPVLEEGPEAKRFTYRLVLERIAKPRR